jgi:hypothetical protein
VAFLAGLQNIFGGNSAPVVGAAPAAAGSPGSIPEGAGTTGANTTVPATEAEPAAPLADFAKLWERNASDTTQQPVIGAVDPKKLMEAAQKTDFAKAIPKDTMAKIQAGGQEGQEAFAQAMNLVTQTVYANSAMATAKIVEQALAKQQSNFEAKLPQIIKQHQLSDTLRSENPVFSNPAVKPLINAMEHQLATKFPDASASELTAMAKQYVEGLGAVFAPKAEQTPAEKSAAAKEIDWSALFGV